MSGAANESLANPRRPNKVPWRIGLLVDWAYTTQPMIDYVDAVSLALEEAHQGGVIDRPVELVGRKLHGGPNASALDVRAAFRELVDQERVLGMIGPTLPDDMMAVRDDIDRARVPVLSFGGTLGLSSPFLFQLPNGTYVDEIRMIINYARAQGVRRIALVRDMSMMGEEYTSTFQLAMREARMPIAAVAAIPPAPTRADLDQAFADVAASGADALLVITVAVHQHFVEALSRIEWRPQHRLMVCNFVAAIPGFDGPQAFEGWVGVDQFDEANPVFTRMVDAFEARYARRVGHTYQAIGYDIGRALARALSMMAPSTPEGLRDALERVRMLPAAAGAAGTVVSFSKNDRRGYKGDYLVYRTVEAGFNKPLGGLSKYLGSTPLQPRTL
ncbi:MAG TPA: ABC transporter substrate-binding protein [Ramlibacter sp.]|nr:ABC transporter substrate-binding protein [Ramlibacter sp.]